MRYMVVGAVGLAMLGSHAIAQQTTRSTFVITRDADTVAVEEFTRTPTMLTGDLRLMPQGTLTHYVAYLRPDGSAERVEVVDSGRNFFTGTRLFNRDRDALRATQRAGSANDRIEMAPPNSYPSIGTSIALMEQLVRATHPGVGDSASIDVINIRNGVMGALKVTRMSIDSVEIVCNGCMRPGVGEEIRAALSKNGDITGGLAPLPHWTITRQ